MLVSLHCQQSFDSKNDSASFVGVYEPKEDEPGIRVLDVLWGPDHSDHLVVNRMFPFLVERDCCVSLSWPEGLEILGTNLYTDCLYPRRRRLAFVWERQHRLICDFGFGNEAAELWDRTGLVSQSDTQTRISWTVSRTLLFGRR